MARQMTKEVASALAKTRWPEKYPVDTALVQLKRQRDGLIAEHLREVGRLDQVIGAMETFVNGMEARGATATAPAVGETPTRFTRPPRPKERAHIPKVCLQCGKSYRAKRSHSRFHSKECAYNWKQSQFKGTCEYCHRPFTSGKEGSRFCSPRCVLMGAAIPGGKRARQAKARGVTLIPGDNTRA